MRRSGRQALDVNSRPKPPKLSSLTGNCKWYPGLKSGQKNMWLETQSFSMLFNIILFLFTTGWNLKDWFAVIWCKQGAGFFPSQKCPRLRKSQLSLEQTQILANSECQHKLRAKNKFLFFTWQHNNCHWKTSSKKRDLYPGYLYILATFTLWRLTNMILV